MEKHCPKCEKSLPLDSFVRRKLKSGGWGHVSWCSPCRNAKAKKQWANGEIRHSVYKRKYGITVAEYDIMLASQGNGCAICKTTEPTGHGKKNGRFSVDHDHETGEVRGLLCHACNVALGSFKDNVEILKNAIFYIQRHSDGVENRPLLTAALQDALKRIEALEARP